MCEFLFPQINGSHRTITIQRRMVHRHRFPRSEQLSAPTKSHRRHQNNWSTRLSCRRQVKRHTLKVSDLYQTLFTLLATRDHFASRFEENWCRKNGKQHAVFHVFKIYLKLLCLICFLFISWSQNVMWALKSAWFRNGSLNWPYLVRRPSFFIQSISVLFGKDLFGVPIKSLPTIRYGN